MVSLRVALSLGRLFLAVIKHPLLNIAVLNPPPLCILLVIQCTSSLAVAVISLYLGYSSTPTVFWHNVCTLLVIFSQ